MGYSNLLNQTVSIQNQSGKDKFGREQVGSSASSSARMQVGRKTRVLPNNETMTIDAICFLPAGTTISRADKVTYDGVEYKVFSISKKIGGNGAVHHLELELQKWEM